MSLDIPQHATREVEVDAPGSLDELRSRAREEELAPEADEALLRYAIYLGMGYVQAESVAEEAEDWGAAYARLHKLLGGVSGQAAVVRFHYSEQGRQFAEEERAKAAHERMAGAFEALVEKMQEEIAVREERVRHLEEALG